MIEVKYISENEAAAWDKYVKKNPRASFCHRYGWKRIIENAIGHKCYYVAAFDGNEITGVLPLSHAKSLLFGNVLASTAFCMYGGAVADSDDIEKALIDEACELAENLNVDYLELRYNRKIETNLLEKSAHSYFVKELAENDEQILAEIKKKQRAVVRHSLKNQLTFRVDNDLDTLYRIYSTSVRNLGTPVFSKRLFATLLHEFKEDVDILTVEQDGKALSSVMNFYHKNTVMPYYGGGLFEARQTKSNDFMYYQLMCHARNKGCHTFDFGRSKNESGAFKYKATWGIEAQDLYHYYYLVKAKSLPNLSPNNPKYQRFIKMWQKLPLKLSQLIGPFLSKYLG